MRAVALAGAGLTDGQILTVLRQHPPTVERGNVDYHIALVIPKARAAVAAERDPLGADRSNGSEPKDEKPLSLLDRLRAALLDTAAVERLQPADPLIDGWLYQDTLAILYGPSGHGKTFLALDWTLHVATNRKWNSRSVASGPVLYVIAEGATGIGVRLAAWRTHHGVASITPTLIDQPQPIHWLPRAVNLFMFDSASALTQLASELRPTLIVIDTLHRCLPGVEENSAKDMGEVIASLDMIRRASGACVLLVHHSGMDITRGARGSSALKAAVDTEIEFSGAENRLLLKCTKQKDGAEPSPLWLTRVEVDESCVLVPTDQVLPSDEIGPGERETLDALRRVQVPGGVSTSVWLKAAECAESTFYRHRANLVIRGLVANLGTDKQPRYAVAGAEEPGSGSG